MTRGRARKDNDYFYRATNIEFFTKNKEDLMFNPIQVEEVKFYQPKHFASKIFPLSKETGE